MVDGRRYIYFGGTGYLGLASHPKVVEAACAAVRRYGVHAATSRHGFGHTPAILDAERAVAEFFETEDAFYYASGYLVNHIMLQALASRVDSVFVDRHSHYCVWEAARLSGKKVTAFAHRDPNDLQSQLAAHLQRGQRPLVMTDGVFPITGALAPLPDYLDVLSAYPGAVLHVDDAHGFGVLGGRGRGTLEHFGLWGDQATWREPSTGPFLTVCGTLSKALGGYGGVIPGSGDFIRHVRSSSHYYDGASAPSSADAGASAAALRIAREEPSLRDCLRRNSSLLRSGLRDLGLSVEDGPSAHFSLSVGTAGDMGRLHQELRNSGYLVPYATVYPGLGPEGALRFAVCALHTPEMIQGLLARLKELLGSHPAAYR